MKKLTLLAIVSMLLVAVVAFASIGEASANACTTIQSGDLVGSDGNTLTVGFDDWGLLD